MLKKAIWIIALIAIVGVLTYGAVNRTLAKTNDTETRNETASLTTNHEQGVEVAGGQGWGRGQAESVGSEADHAVTEQGYGRQNQNATTVTGQGQGNGRGQNRQAEQDQEAFGEAEPSGQGYGRQNQNRQVNRRRARAMAGQGRNRQTEQAAAGIPEAEHTEMEWQSVQGKVVSLAADTMTVETASGATVLVEGRPWSYAQEAGFAAALGDVVTLNGFDEEGEFKVGELANDDSGQFVQIREIDGRPLWAGNGQGRNRN